MVYYTYTDRDYKPAYFMSGFKAIEQELKSGRIDEARVFLLCGSESFLVRHYEGLLTERFAADDPTGLNISVHYGDEADEGGILADCETVPMFAPRRVVLVRNPAGLATGKEDEDKGTAGKGAAGTADEVFAGKGAGRGSAAAKASSLADGLPRIPETTKLILTAGAANKGRALYKAVAKAGKIFEFDRLSSEELIAFAKKRFRQARLEIGEPVLEDFLARTGYMDRDSQTDLFKVDGEAQKIAIYVRSEDRASVTAQDLDDCLGENLQTDVFQLVDAISAGDKSRAIRLLEYRLESGESVFALLTRVISQFETMLGWKEMEEKGGYSAARRLELLPVNHEWQMKKLGGISRNYSMGELCAILRRLYALDRDIKSGNVPERLALTLLVAEI